ncbi:helix-turn-helix domain-containing protein [Actinokineospora iranica]|uniref:Helix-turn-helix domain-containing protein n=1 Tax=Actinokineospora iranica TaxID=1271860 RepID=A0A1G6W9C1_9PSEU|nr:helix-turn-helix transcriptional regulator [Actinokineospora iranica]SDD62409.1 Helix-turn-helix domain-containing protein [Actinokineospora iranica]
MSQHRSQQLSNPVRAGKVSQPEFGQRLKSLRLSRGMSQRDLVSGGTISASYVSLLEAGNRVPTLEVVHQLAKVLGVRARDLAGDSWPEEEAPSTVRTSEHDSGQLMTRILTQSAFASGDLVDARRHAEDSFDRARQFGEPTAIIESGMSLQRILGMTNEHRHRLTVLDELAKVAETAGLETILLSINIDLATACRAVGEMSRARTLLSETQHALVTSPLAGTAEEVRLYAVQISVLCDLDESPLAIELIDPMLAAAATLDSPATSGRAYWTAAVALGRAGRREDALAHLERARDSLNGSMPVQDWLRFCRAAASIQLDCGGDLAEVKKLIADARSAQRTLSMSTDRDEVDSLEARYELASGNPREAMRICQEVLARGEVAGYELLRSRRTLALAAEEAEENETARTQLRILAADAEEEGALSIAVWAWKRLEGLRDKNA